MIDNPRGRLTPEAEEEAKEHITIIVKRESPERIMEESTLTREEAKETRGAETRPQERTEVAASPGWTREVSLEWEITTESTTIEGGTTTSNHLDTTSISKMIIETSSPRHLAQDLTEDLGVEMINLEHTEVAIGTRTDMNIIESQESQEKRIESSTAAWEAEGRAEAEENSEVEVEESSRIEESSEDEASSEAEVEGLRAETITQDLKKEPKGKCFTRERTEKKVASEEEAASIEELSVVLEEVEMTSGKEEEETTSGKEEAEMTSGKEAAEMNLDIEEAERTLHQGAEDKTLVEERDKRRMVNSKGTLEEMSIHSQEVASEAEGASQATRIDLSEAEAEELTSEEEEENSFLEVTSAEEAEENSFTEVTSVEEAEETSVEIEAEETMAEDEVIIKIERTSGEEAEAVNSREDKLSKGEASDTTEEVASVWCDW
jgi:hypothetical protein